MIQKRLVTTIGERYESRRCSVDGGTSARIEQTDDAENELTQRRNSKGPSPSQAGNPSRCRHGFKRRNAANLLAMSAYGACIMYVR